MASRACNLLLPAEDSVRRGVEVAVAERGDEMLPLRVTPLDPRVLGAVRGGILSYESTGPKVESQYRIIDKHKRISLEGVRSRLEASA